MELFLELSCVGANVVQCSSCAVTHFFFFYLEENDEYQSDDIFTDEYKLCLFV